MPFDPCCAVPHGDPEPVIALALDLPSAPLLPLWAAFVALTLLAATLAALAWRAARTRVAGSWATVALLGGVVAFAVRDRALALGPVRIEPFGVALAAGLALGVAVSARLARRANLELALGIDALVGAGIGALLGGRAAFVLETPPFSWAAVLAFQAGGLCGFGAVFGAALGATVALRFRAAPVLAWLDAGAVGVLAVVVVTRLGCYWAGCHFGTPLSDAAPSALRALGSVGGRVPVHPLPLYEAGAALLLAVAAVFARARLRRHGVMFSGLALGYAAVRLAEVFLTGPATRELYGLALDVWLTLATFVLISSANLVRRAWARLLDRRG